jgi:peptidoglycan-associated lipoprotein
MTSSRKKGVGITLLFSALLAFGCHGKTAAAPPPPPPPPPPAPTPSPAPTITLRAQPGTIDRGGSTTLQWTAQNATSVTITPGVGDVAATGNRAVNPQSSVTYTATAMGPGGSATDTARITVNIPAAPEARVPDRTPPKVTATTFADSVKTIYFDYDKADIRPEEMTKLQANASWLKANPGSRFTVEGHCDDRGSEEYNLALGDRRANAVKEYLVGQGVAANRIMTVSYGEERPVCRDETEDCFGKNRRAEFKENQ